MGAPDNTIINTTKPEEKDKNPNGKPGSEGAGHNGGASKDIGDTSVPSPGRFLDDKAEPSNAFDVSTGDDHSDVVGEAYRGYRDVLLAKALILK